MKLIILFTFIFFFAQHDTIASCNINGPNEILEKIKRHHPEIKVNDAQKEILQQSVSIAGMRPNPELDAEANIADTSTGNIYTAGLSLKHTFEIGGKRNSRIKVAESLLKTGMANAETKNTDAIIDSVLRLHRLRQVHELIPIYEESLQSFNKILKLLRRGKLLSPEQQVERETLGLAVNDYKLKIAQLVSEKLNLNKHLSFFMGEKCQIPFSSLPNLTKLANVSLNGINVDKNSKLKAAKSQLEFANSTLELEKSKSYPNIQIGPTFEYQKASFTHSNSFGIALRMDLPIFSSNGPGKARAQKQIAASQKILENIRIESELDIEAWIAKYKQYRHSLNTIADKKKLERKHRRIEALFKRGVISTALVIESHRQLTEFFTTRFEFEIGAVEALWNIYKLSGEINNKKL